MSGARLTSGAGGGGGVVDITQWYSPTSGGIRTYLHAKARWAERCGRAHAAIVPGESEGPLRVGAGTFIAVRGRTATRRWGYRLVARPAGVIAALERLAPRVVVLNDALAFPHAVARWAARRGTPLVMLCHSDLALAANGLPAGARRVAGAMLARVQGHALAVPHLVIVASGATMRRVESRTTARVVLSPLGVDTEAFAVGRADARLRRRLAPGGGPLLLYAGRLSREKRVDLLPEMMTHLPEEAVLAIAGTGAAATRVRRIALRLGVSDRVRMLGHVSSRRELAGLMASADCFVHPNPDEPFGLCPLEARAVGCRVVVPGGSGAAEVLGGRGAVVVPPGSAPALAEGVARALAAGRPGPADLSDLSWDATFRREWDLYEDLVSTACA